MFWRPKLTKIPQQVIGICRKLSSHGYRGYIVGGSVRDSLLHLNPSDWDITTDAVPEMICTIFPQTIPKGIKFGTVTVIKGGFLVDVTTMRQDATYSNQRHPDYVNFCSNVETDLSRRDFTINAIAYDPLMQEFIDPFGGISDLRRKRIRTVGNPDTRFKEDALRMLRLIRFMALLGFKPNKQTINAIQPRLMRNIAQERIKDELSKLLVAKKIIYPLQLMYTSGIMKEILPELANCAGIEQGSYHRWDVLNHSIKSAQVIKEDLVLRLAALLHDIGKTETKTQDAKGVHFYGHDKIGATMAGQVLSRLTYSKRIQAQVSLLIRYHMFQIHPNSTDKAIRRLIAKVGRNNIVNLLELRKADILGMKYNSRRTLNYYMQMHQRIKQILDEDQVFGLKDLALSGHDLIKELDLKPGPLIGKTLNYLFEAAIAQPEINNYKVLISLAKDYIEKS